LLEAGARLDLADEHQMTALDLAEYQVAEAQKINDFWREKTPGKILNHC
jgi:hypothetical protein